MKPEDVPAEIIRKLAVPGPRYTSYPPANIWTDATPDDFAGALSSLANGNATVSIYVHVPYCRVRCAYCALNVSGSRDPKRHDAYVDAVIREAQQIQALAGGALRCSEMAWGGGTPTTLSAAELARLAAGITAAIPPTSDARMSVEVDPRTTDRAKVDALYGSGFRRLSMGVQDVHAEVQEAAGRIQSPELSRACLEMARDAGFEGINVDLMYGLPRQSVPQFTETLETVTAWEPERFSLFGYAHLPARFANQRRIREEDLPDLSGRLALLLTAAERMAAHGYHWIGLDHFVRKEDELWTALKAGTLGRSFMGYVPQRNATLLGLGASAIGEAGGMFVQNARDEQDYVAAIQSRGLATVRGYRRQGEDDLRADVIEKLMCLLEVDLAKEAARYGVDATSVFADALHELDGHAADGLVERDGLALRVTPLGRLFLRNVCMTFDQHRPVRDIATQSTTV